MDCETKILLNKLVEAVDSPDWWAIGITVVNALMMVWLGWRQYKLQQRQVRQQEYEIYSKLYKLVKRADVEIEHFLDEIVESLGVIRSKRADNGFLKLKLDYIERICNDLEQNAIDFEIKFTKDFFDLDGYRDILGFMAYNLKSLVMMVEEKKMHYDIPGSITIDCVDASLEKGQAYYIAQHIKDKQYEVVIGSNLLDFIERKNKLRKNSNDILARIRERCKVE